jgi:hypothetical protein
MKLNALKFALAAGINLSLMGALITIAALFKVPGCLEFAEVLVKLYGPYGYSISWAGVVIGAFWGFVEGFVHIGLLGWIYNKLLDCKKEEVKK